MQSRYYDSAIGRFINADSLVSTGQGILGNNMFAYCANSPIAKADPYGTAPYELFNSADDAAIDFGMYYNAESIADKQEYGSSIFKVGHFETRTYLVTKTIYFFNIPISITYTVRKRVMVAKYYYNKANVGRNGNTVIPNFVGSGVLVATVHTHANYDPQYNLGNDTFSTCAGGDMFWANLFRMNMYLATPSGYLIKYTYADRNSENGGITTISTDIPWDPNSPYR